ncbi:unnamed protein product [Sphacelaria rigidula]
MPRRMNVAAFIGALAVVGWATPAETQECSDGTPGLESTSFDVCCSLECGFCGGAQCGLQNTTNGPFDCCVTEIKASNILCSESGAAPCNLEATSASSNSTCDNGLTGVQDPSSDVCCPIVCGDECGGEGCGTIVGTSPSDCCYQSIIDSGRDCAVTMEAPCFDTTVAQSNTTCSNGYEGVEDPIKGVCCNPACPTCGGLGCGDYPGLSSSDCCSGTIASFGDQCEDVAQAPCVLPAPEYAPSMCPNGLAGVQDGEVCCAEPCGQCGGEGCGSILGTAGASDCCSANILADGVMCEQGVAAPCIMVNGTYTDAPAVAPVNPLVGATPAPTAGDRAIDFSMAPTAVGAAMVSVAPTGAPTTGSRDLDFGTGAPSAAPTGVDGLVDGYSAAPTTGSRAVGSAAPTTSGSTPPPGLSEDFTLPPVASSSAAPSTSSTGSFVTLAAIAAGVFAVHAARN